MALRNNIVPAPEVPIRSNRQIYHAGIPERVVAMAQQGRFPEEWCAELGVSMRTIYAWANDRPEFEDAVEHAWHLLHAYWARLLRENITNPAFRQSAALQVMAKRFPATWGKEPRNTLENFSARNERTSDGGVQLCRNCEDLERMSEEELCAELEMLRKRHDY